MSSRAQRGIFPSAIGRRRELNQPHAPQIDTVTPNDVRVAQLAADATRKHKEDHAPRSQLSKYRDSRKLDVTFEQLQAAPKRAAKLRNEERRRIKGQQFGATATAFSFLRFRHHFMELGPSSEHANILGVNANTKLTLRLSGM